MQTNRPDIFKAIGIFLGAICFVFIIKLIIFMFSILAIFIAAIKKYIRRNICQTKKLSITR